MYKPYKFELGEYYWWSEPEKQVLLQGAICKYNEHGLDTTIYVLEKANGCNERVAEQDLIGQLRKSNTESPHQDRIDDLVEQVKEALNRAGAGWEHPILLPPNSNTLGVPLVCLSDLQRALRAYLDEENP